MYCPGWIKMNTKQGVGEKAKRVERSFSRVGPV